MQQLEQVQVQVELELEVEVEVTSTLAVLLQLCTGFPVHDIVLVLPFSPDETILREGDLVTQISFPCFSSALFSTTIIKSSRQLATTYTQ
jgi:hypothetical protein